MQAKSDYADLRKRLQMIADELEPDLTLEHEGVQIALREAADAIAALAAKLEEARAQSNEFEMGEAGMRSTLSALKREVLEAIEAERLWDQQDNDGDHAYNQAVADCYTAAKRAMSRARDAQDHGEEEK